MRSRNAGGDRRSASVEVLFLGNCGAVPWLPVTVEEPVITTVEPLSSQLFVSLFRFTFPPFETLSPSVRPARSLLGPAPSRRRTVFTRLLCLLHTAARSL